MRSPCGSSGLSDSPDANRAIQRDPRIEWLSTSQHVHPGHFDSPERSGCRTDKHRLSLQRPKQRFDRIHGSTLHEADRWAWRSHSLAAQNAGASGSVLTTMACMRTAPLPIAGIQPPGAARSESETAMRWCNDQSMDGSRHPSQPPRPFRQLVVVHSDDQRQWVVCNELAQVLGAVGMSGLAFGRVHNDSTDSMSERWPVRAPRHWQMLRPPPASFLSAMTIPCPEPSQLPGGRGHPNIF